MSIGIKVAIRCRPFTIDDDLGVHMVQNGDENGEVNLLKSSYSNNRFAFSWSWWSAFGWERHAKDNPPEAAAMTLITQDDVYIQCGQKIKAELYEGNAIVLFAYGLSGSGKTFTVFGPDAVDIPEAWFKHSTPHSMWGIFPHLAYEIFQDKTDGWKITMKYFQNVVDTVRDLMSPTAMEQQYKAGMRKDEDGFTDIEWCQSVVLRNWDDLRKNFMSANARKAIAPTQFNHQSTRGHCIMTLEVEMPKPDDNTMKQRGRIYVCDLAGTEPAGDIYYANYQKLSFDDGSIEMKLLGPHQDQRKTKELQDQGKKINLSLSEMAQFFMKMAEAMKANKLKPGATIPGCNSYFLCKYLKDTMLQARTYLFCAIRPEVTYHKYTFATLGFATNASVIKLQPKKAMGNASPAERKLMEELEKMKLLVEELQKQNEMIKKSQPVGAAGGGGDDDGDDQVSALQEMLRRKQEELERVVINGGDYEEGGGGGGVVDIEAEYMARQRDEYASRGVSLAHFESGTDLPYFINLDEDAFRNKRFMYILSEETTTFGPGGSIQPLSLSVVKNHCQVQKRGEDIVLVNGKGDTFVNGNKLAEGQEQNLTSFDRVAMGGEVLLFHYPGKDTEGDEPTAEQAVSEYQLGLQQRDNEQQRQFEQRMKEFEEQRKKWEEERQKEIDEMIKKGEEPPPPEVKKGSLPPMPEDFRISKEEEEKQAMEALDKEILDMLPKIKECKDICKMLNRDFLNLEVNLQKPKSNSLGVPKVKIQVTNSRSGESIFLDPVDFVKNYSILKDELVHLRHSIEQDRQYATNAHHDPIFLLFDCLTEIGSSTIFPEYLIYMMDTDEEEIAVEIKNISAPYNNIGLLEVKWTPLSHHPDFAGPDEIPEILDESDLLRKSWTYQIEIKSATGLPVITDMAYVQYEFFGETFTTETVEQNTYSPKFDYKFVHHIDVVTQDFLDYLKRPMEFHIFISPLVSAPKDKIDTTNPIVIARISGLPEPPNEGGHAAVVIHQQSILVGSQNDIVTEVEQLRKKNHELEQRVVDLTTQLNAALTELVKYKDTSRARSRIDSARATDQALNNSSDGDLIDL